MMCWERDIYLQLVVDYQEKKKQKEMTAHNGANFFNL